MEQPCYKCGQLVQEGVPFCPHCSGPQIRVVIAEPLRPAASLEAAHASAVLPASQPLPVLALPIRWSQTIRPCAIAALIASVLMSLGLNPFVAMICVGFLAIVLYRQRWKDAPLGARAGAGVGALAGLLWFAVASIIEALFVLVAHKGPEIRNALLQVIDQAASRTADPQVLTMLSRLRTPEGIEVLMAVGIITSFLAALVLAAIGGALGGAILGRRDKP